MTSPTMTEHPIPNPFMSEIRKMKASLARIEQWMTDEYTPATVPDVCCDDVISWVGFEWRMEPEEIMRRGKQADRVLARQAAMYLASALTPLSMVQIGKRIGGHHHTTVLHAVKLIGIRRGTDSALNTKLSSIESKLKR